MLESINPIIQNIAAFFANSTGPRYFGSTLEQYILFFLIIIIVVLATKILSFIITKYGSKLTSKTETDFDDVMLEAIQLPMLFAGFIVGLFIGYQFLSPDVEFIKNNFLSAVNALIIIDITYFALKLVDAIIEYFVIPLSNKTESKLDDQMIPILSKLAKSSIVLLSFVIILSSFGIDVLPLIAGLGIGGLAVAFAAQKTVEDMFGGLTIFISKPFIVGDAIKTSGIEGNVETVGLRNTRIRDWDGRLNTLPNSKVVQDVILNISSEPSRRVSVTLGLTYSTSYAQMQKAMQTLKDIINERKDCEKDPRAVFKEYADSSLNIWFVYFIKDQDRKFEIMSEVNMEIKKRFEKAKLNFAFPSQSIYIEQMKK